MAPTSTITSQRQAQEALYHYMQATLQQLPYDVTLDNTRYGGGRSASTCDDRIDQENAPITYNDYRDMHVPPGIDYHDLVAKVGDIWKGWGWRVVERDGFDKPNRFGYSSDGYELDIQGRPAQFATFPPAFGGMTPCLSPKLRDDHVPVPTVITRDNVQYDQPSATQTR